LGPTRTLSQCVPAIPYPGGKATQAQNLTTHLHMGLKLGMSGSLLLPSASLHGVERDNFEFYHIDCIIGSVLNKELHLKNMYFIF
jgi:hypothetical protein